MEPSSIGPLKIRAEIERWPLAAPFRIATRTYEVADVLLVELEKDGHVGRGEASGVDYRNENAASMLAEIESLRTAIEPGISRSALKSMLPAGGARNALDSALWDLEAKLTGRGAWQIAGLERPRPLLGVFTCGADEPARMAAAAQAYVSARAIKLKLTGDPIDAARVRAVRDVRPDVWLSVDANQGFTRPFLERLMPVLVEARVALIEQPFAIGQEALLDGFQSPIPIVADESVQSLSDMAALIGRFSTINIKLDKCGGLSEGLAMARAARAMGFETWVGNMIGTSLAMAPAFLLGQLCNVVELDGPIFLKVDRSIPIQYSDGFVMCPDALWGNPE
jgi:L-alanine-DL-glutamate epimerase-like enolase superfamily enzyme